MPFAFLLALAAVAGATTLTYLYDRDAPLWPRLCAGVCVGLAALGLVGFALASLLGMTAGALALSGVAAASPLLLLLKPERRERLMADARRSVGATKKAGAGVVVFYLAAAVLFWMVFAGAMYETREGVFTATDTNIGDLPFHVAVITGFAHGENFPPEHPEFAGARLTYPFVVDFVTAMFVRAGATLEGALFWQNLAMMLALVGLLHRWALELTRDRAAALMTPALVLLSGGFGWLAFAKEAATGERGVFGLLASLPHDYTIMRHIGYAWGNAVTALFVPQRSILLGVAVAIVVWTLWWQAAGEEPEAKGAGVKDKGRAGRKKPKRGGKAGRETEAPAARDESLAFLLKPFRLTPMIAAGLVAGLLPLTHAHSFVVMMLMGACLALLQAGALMFWKDGREGAGLWAVWRPWAAFAAAASALAVPQMLWATSGSSVQAGRFFGWEFGWDNGEENAVWFWVKNTGVFIPVLLAALALRWRPRLVTPRLLYFYLPFTLCFVVPNVYKLSPWVWDNIKVLLYWWIASAPLVALVLARLWRRGGALKAAAAALLVAQTLAGGLDVWRAASGAVAHRTFDADGLRLAELIMRETPPRSLILHAPTYNDPVYMTGRRTFLGYPGHIWSHGLDHTGRERELKSIYAGGPDASALIASNRIQYVVVGPLEREEMRKYGLRINETFFQRYTKVGEAGEYRLYKTTQQ
ncbi:MAG TPA: hypothetical protein VD968_01970 [Pyrinomonadaceae bacterium]|nr:hypothetical protein [Pyrinomonadaceae bacterium]